MDDIIIEGDDQEKIIDAIPNQRLRST